MKTTQKVSCVDAPTRPQPRRTVQEWIRDEWIRSREKFEITRLDMIRACTSAQEAGLPDEVIESLRDYIDQLYECDRVIERNIREYDKY